VTGPVTWWAPGRVNLIGEHTDHNDGFVLPLALPIGVRVRASVAARCRVRSAQQDTVARFCAATVRPGDVEGWAAYVAGVCWALRTGGHAVPDVELEVDGDVPAGSGLASSAALGCAFAGALAELAGLRLGRTELALLVRHAEREFVGVPCGPMDHLAAMHGRRGALVFLDCRSLQVAHVPFDPPGWGLALLVVDTGAPRALTDGRYAQRRAQCAAAAQALGVATLRETSAADVAGLPDGVLRARARHVVEENARVLEVVAVLRAGVDPRATGRLLTASHVSLREDFAVTVPRLDLAVDAVLAAGAYGARMTGAGFGGCVLALVDRAATGAVVAAVERAFHAHGFGRPRTFEAVPSDGARRLG